MIVMANPHLSTTLARFDATVHRTKNRLIAIPSAVQRQLGLERRANNHIVLYSIRLQGGGRWNHHLAYLTKDNEFAVPTDVQQIEAGASVEVKLHRVIPDADALVSSESGGALLRRIGQEADETTLQDTRADGSQRVDDYLNEDVHG
jgi:hypothetical protein